MPHSLTRRQKLILNYTLLGTAIVLAALSFLLWQGNQRGPYRPGEKVEGITSELSRDIPADYPRVQFRNVADEAGIHFKHFQGKRSTQLPEDMGSGAAWGDYDNDGDPDLYVCDMAAPLTATPEELAASPGGNRLYRNNGDGTFTDVTEAAGVGYKGFSMAAAWADYDNDGHLDLVVTSYDRLILYRNRGDGSFQDATEPAGLAGFRGFWAGASWADYDRDGDVDLYICGYVQYDFKPEFVGRTSRQYTELVPFTLNPSSYPAERNLLFQNNGKGGFRELARTAGVDNPTGRSLAAAWADFDGDGWPDLYVANDISDNAMFLNLGKGRFRDVSHEAWVADYRGAMGLGVGDWDRDGDPDIFITHWIAQQFALFSNLRYQPAVAANPGPLRFQDVADLIGVGQLTFSFIGWGTSFFDYDNDGQLDLLAVNGSTFQDLKDPSQLVPMKNLLFWQRNSKEGFYEVGAVSGDVFGELHVGRGAAFADYDNDGDIDIFVVNHSGRALLLRNDGGNTNHWLKVRLRCTRSNRSCFGAVVGIEYEGKQLQQEIGSQASYLSQNFFEVHVGLNRARQVERVRVRFPSGLTRELREIPANQVVVVEESLR